jgi:hypothetical protein
VQPGVTQAPAVVSVWHALLQAPVHLHCGSAVVQDVMFVEPPLGHAVVWLHAPVNLHCGSAPVHDALSVLAVVGHAVVWLQEPVHWQPPLVLHAD